MKKLFLLFMAVVIHAQTTDTDRADELILNNKFKEAVEILEEYVDKNKDAEAYLKLGNCYKNLYKNNDALSAYEKADEIDPGNVNILVNLAAAYSTIGYTEKAIETFTKVLALDKGHYYTYINLVKLFIDVNRLNEAKSLLTELLSSDSTNSYLNRQMAYVHQKLENYDLARLHYKKSFTHNQKDIFTISNLARLYYNSEFPDSAVTLINKGLESFPSNVQLLKLKADILYSEKEYGGAVNTFVKILANEDESSQIYQRLGICYYQIALENFVGDAQIEKLESAAETLLKSFRIDSTHSLSALYLGMTYKELNRNTAALYYLEKAVELIYPKYTPAIFTNLAIVNQREENYPEAIKYFKEAQKFDRNNPNYWYYLAALYDQYYYDKTVPLIYYELYLSQNDSTDERLSKYANERVSQLKEKVHFQNGKL